MPKSKAQELALFAQHLNSNGQLNAITMSVDGLTDVDTTTTAPTNGQSLVWDGANFVPGAGGGGSNTNEITEGSDNSVGESTLGAADGTNNLYYTDARFDTRLSAKNTGDLAEGSNLYFTNERVDDRVNQLLVAGTNIGLSYDDANNTYTINSDNTGGYNLANNTTDNLSEGSTNLYYTNARVDARIASNTGGSLDLSSKTTTDLSEGTNLYYTDARVDTHLNQSNPTAGYVLSWNGSDYAWIDNTGYTAFNTDFDTRLATKDTGDLSEGTNLYYTDARVQTYIDGARDYGNITVVSTDAGSSAGPDLILYRNSASPASSDYIGQIQFKGKNSNGADEIYAKVTGKITDPTLNSEDGLLETAIKGGGSFTIVSRQLPDKFYLINGVGLSVAGNMDLFGTLNSHTIPGGTGTIALTSDIPTAYTDSDVNTFLAGGTAGNIVTTGYIAGPASFTIDPAAVGDNTGTVIIAGNLQVDGTTTTINSTTLDVDDLNITVASGAANAGAANGAGLTVDGASATLTYVNPGDNWAFNKPLDMGANNITTTGKILYSNVYSAEGDLPSASTYHGMFAHVHGTGKGYFAHGGNWIKLLDETSSTTTNLSEGTNLYYTDTRADARIALQVGANLDLSNKSTSDLSEGTNLYYTDARVDTHLNQSSAGSNQILSWNGSDYAWVAQTTGYGDSNVDTHLNTSTASTNEVLAWNGSDYDWVAQSGGIALTSLSVGAEATAAGDGAIAYNNSNGVFTYTPPVLSGLTGDTDDISEGSTNQYFTSARVQAENLGGSLAGTISDAKMQYATSYSGTAVQGSFFFDSLNAKVKVYNGSAFVDAVPAGGGGGGGSSTDANTTFRKYIYTTSSATNSVSGKDDEVVTAGNFVEGYQYEIISTGTTNFVSIGAANSNVGTTFTATGTGSGTGTAGHILNYATNGTENVEVYVNGIKQVEGSSNDYVATTGTSVNFVSNFASGDVVDIQVYELLTNSAYYTKTETYTQAEVNSQISTAVGGNLTLTGLTVDTDTLKVDTSNNRVGIGTNTADTRLHVHQSTDNTAGGIQVRNSGDTSGMFMYVDASNDGHIDMGTAGNLEFRTNSTTQAIINTSGQLILGNGATTTALTNVTIYDGADNSQIQFVTNNTGTTSANGARVGYNGNGVQLWNFENNYARIATNNLARMYITNTGQFEFSTGTADGSPNYDFDFWSQTTPTLSVRTSATSGQDAVFRIEGARTGSTGDTARIDFVNGASTGEYTMAKISGYDPTGNSSALDGGFRIQTTDNNSFVTVLEVDNNKEFIVGDVNEGKISGSTRFTVMNDDNPTGRTMDVWRGSSTGSNHIQNWYSNVGGTKALVAAVEANGDFNSATSSYAGISDARLKENIVDATSQLDDIKAVQVRNFNFINTPDTTLLGVVAQELEASGMTGLVKTANDEDSGEEIKSVKYSVLYMKAIKALQETIAKVEALETENTAIRARLDALENSE